MRARLVVEGEGVQEDREIYCRMLAGSVVGYWLFFMELIDGEFGFIKSLISYIILNSACPVVYSPTRAE